MIDNIDLLNMNAKTTHKITPEQQSRPYVTSVEMNQPTEKSMFYHQRLPWIVFPAVVCVIAIFFEYSGFDLWSESHFFNSQLSTWPYKQSWLFNSVIHSGGRVFDKTIGFIWLIAFLATLFVKKYHNVQKLLLFFLIATISGPVIVGISKSITHIYSPWDLLLFNGHEPYIRLFDHVPNGLPVGHAFPAGHASGGYCFLSLYFVFFRYRSRLRFCGLFFGLTTGILFGIGQQIRGAHFLSHDLFTCGICWVTCMIIYFIFYPDELNVKKMPGH